MEKTKMFQKNIYFCFLEYAKAFDCVDHNKLWKILKQMELPGHFTCLLRILYVGQNKLWKILREMGIPDHLTCFLRNLYVGQEATKLDMEQGLVQNWERSVTGYILSPC